MDLRICCCTQVRSLLTLAVRPRNAAALGLRRRVRCAEAQMPAAPAATAAAAAAAAAVGAVGAAGCCALAAWRRGDQAPEAAAAAPEAAAAAPEAAAPDVDFAALNAALGPRPPDEEVLYEAWSSQAGPVGGQGLAPGWGWVREEPGWRVSEEGQLLLRSAPGSGGEANAAGIRNLLLRDFPAPPAGGWGRAAAATVAHTGMGRGDQAGLVWYHDDRNYMKLVLQMDPGGEQSVVFAVVVDGEAALVAKKECPAAPAALRLELAPGGASATAILDIGYCEQLVGVCEDVQGLGLAGDGARVGLMANGAPAAGSQPSGFAAFSRFCLLALAPDRVSFASGPATSEAHTLPVGGLTVYGQAPGPADGAAVESSMEMGAAAPNLQGWTLSEELSEGDRAEIAGMLSGLVAAPPGSERESSAPAFEIVEHN
jgi:hypothetical protein